jgi:diguanylate cyclase (GGDEF)-like protein/PAS domain S-box-containing protein
MVKNSSTDVSRVGASPVAALALAHRLEHFQAIVQCSDDAIVSKTLDGLVTSWNSGAQSIFGYTEQEMLGKSMLVLFPPERIGEEAFILKQVRSGAQVDHFETERLHKNGNRIQVSVTISPIRDREGVVIGASKIARDITQKVKLEASARLSNAILCSTDDAVVSKSLNGIVTSWNLAATKIFGYTADEMLGHSVQVLLPPDRQDEERFILEKVRRGGTIDHFETVRVCKSGKRINVSVTISPIRDGSGKVIGASKIARDITAQKLTDAHLRLTSRVFTATSEGILITNADGLIVDVNEAFTRITGYGRDEVLGKDPLTFRSGRQSHTVFRTMRCALMRHGEWRGEVWSRRKDGEAFSVLLSVSRVCEAKGAITNYVALFSDITPLKLQQERLEHGAHFDALTDLPNRLLLSDRLQQAMLNCQRHDQILAVVYLDIDSFKTINDTFGHSVGDELLVAVAHQMRGVLREGDTLARMGGDEFVIVLADLHGVEDCVQLVNRVLAACARPVPVGDSEQSITVSIGVTMYPNDNVDADQLMRNADFAMYEAKRSGKNRFHLFDAAQDAEVKTRTSEQTRIEQALLRQELVLYYQPKVNMRSGAVLGVEALIRWNHPERGLLAPASFLPAIEKHPLSERVGAWVMAAAFKQLDAWGEAGLKLPVSINVSARQFLDQQFTPKLAALLAWHPRVDPAMVELEILETSALDDMNAVQKIITECHGLGVSFSLDDFGTGYSSLTYLRHLPVDTLKIDQSFIRDMLDDAGNLSIVKGVIGLAVAFNRTVIAEGVETEAHGVQLLAMGCELAQGYAIARPMPAEKVADWVANWRAPQSWLACANPC